MQPPYPGNALTPQCTPSTSTRLSIAGMGAISAKLGEIARFRFQRLGLTRTLASHVSLVLCTGFREPLVANYDPVPRMAQLLVLQLLVDGVRKELRTPGGDAETGRQA